MDEFLIKSAVDGTSLLFFKREPPDHTQSIDGFWVRLSEHNLEAMIQVYAGYAGSHPAPMFVEMAQKWTGWQEELEWVSLEREMSIRCRHDWRGHISIHVRLCPGPMPNDWRVEATIMTEPGQLERLALQAVQFFGQPL